MKISKRVKLINFFLFGNWNRFAIVRFKVFNGCDAVMHLKSVFSGTAKELRLQFIKTKNS